MAPFITLPLWRGFGKTSTTCVLSVLQKMPYHLLSHGSPMHHVVAFFHDGPLVALYSSTRAFLSAGGTAADARESARTRASATVSRSIVMYSATPRHFVVAAVRPRAAGHNEAARHATRARPWEPGLGKEPVARGDMLVAREAVVFGVTASVARNSLDAFGAGSFPSPGSFPSGAARRPAAPPSFCKLIAVCVALRGRRGRRIGRRYGLRPRVGVWLWVLGEARAQVWAED